MAGAGRIGVIARVIRAITASITGIAPNGEESSSAFYGLLTTILRMRHEAIYLQIFKFDFLFLHGNLVFEVMQTSIHLLSKGVTHRYSWLRLLQTQYTSISQWLHAPAKCILIIYKGDTAISRDTAVRVVI